MEQHLQGLALIQLAASRTEARELTPAFPKTRFNNPPELLGLGPLLGNMTAMTLYTSCGRRSSPILDCA